MKKSDPNLSRDGTENSRWILIGAFGGMLLLMIVAGIASLRALEKLGQVSNEVTEQFATRSHALVAVVVTFHSYTDQMEQYLLSDAIVSEAPQAQELTRRGAAVHAAIGNYPRNCGPEERSLLRQIDEHVATEENHFTGVLASSVAQRKQRGRSVVFEQLIPNRIRVLQLADALAALNDKRFTEQNEALVGQFQGLQTRLARMVVLTLLAGWLLSLVAAYYILRLEQRGRERYLALAKSRQELESLSRRLVATQEAERRAISRELHDEVGQTLGALLMDIGNLSKLTRPDDQLLAEQIARIKAAAESSVKSIRDMALLLRPPMLDDLGLVPALEWQAREISRRNEMEVDVHAEELAEDPPNEVKVCIYRVAQEALRNAATHARAKRANVVLRRKDRSITVEIRDDGQGFDPERTRGMGILGMQERVRQLNGTLRMESAPGKGTTVRAELPVELEKASEQ